MKSNDFNALGSLQLVHIFVICAILIIGTFRIAWSKSRLPDWGFTLDKGCWISLGLALIATFFAMQQAPPINFGKTIILLESILIVAVEEILFRVIFIKALIRLFVKKQFNIFIAMSISAALFTIMHIPTKQPLELIGIFTSSLLLGYIFIWTKSALFLISIHIISNTYGAFGIFGGLAVILMYFLLAIAGRFIETRKIPEPVSE